MPDSGVPQPWLDPSQYPAYLDLQKKQMLAQMLMGASQRAGEVPQGWDSMRQVPKVGLGQIGASLVGALMAGKANQSAQKSQLDYMTGLMGGATGPTTAATTDPGMSAPRAQNPMIPQGMSQGTANQAIAMMGPEKYAESFLAPQFKPADIQAQIRAAGIDPNSPMGRNIAQMSLAKATTNLENVRPGGTVYDATAGMPTFTAPDHGVQTSWGPNGPAQSVVPGAPAATAQMTGAETAGKVINTPQTVPTAGGGSTIGYPSDLLGAPPALRDQAAPGATQSAQLIAPKVGTPGQSQTPQGPAAPADSPWASIPKLPISKALGAPDEFTKGTLQEAGKKHGELSSKYGNEADLADQKLQYNEEAQKYLQTAETGPSSEWLTENRAKLLEWGVPESIIPGSDAVTPTMELNKNQKQSALQGARAIFGSRMTQMEVRLQHEELSPSTSMTKDAIASLMQQDDIKQNYAKQRSEDYGKFIAQGGNPLRFESWYAKNYPLTKFAQQQTQAQPAEAAATPRAAPQAGDVVKGHRFKGGDPSMRENWEPL